MTGRLKRQMAVMILLTAPLGIGGVLAAETQLESDPGRAAQVARDLQYKSVIGNQISVLSASNDGTVWAVTTGGTLMHCLFEKTQQRVRCYDRDGPAKPEY